MSSYREQMREAVERTDAWGIDSWHKTLAMNRLSQPPAPPQPRQEYGKKALFFEHLSRTFPLPPEVRSNLCGPVHLLLSTMFMEKELSTAPFITIGEVVWSGDPCFGVTEENLKATLDAGNVPFADIRIHVWLTFPDFTILDFTFMPWQCRQNGEVMDLNETGALKMYGNPDEMVGRYDYKPMLVGPEFLFRTGAVKPHEREAFLVTQAQWLQKFVTIQKKGGG